MSTTPAGIAEADWLATPAAVRAFILAQQGQLCWAHLIRDLTAMAERSSASAAFGAAECCALI
ncbi:hypothetical protein KBZ20_08035 [Vulcanococcus limneticus Candia 3F8]|nr:hypothetical protein [Vulcanococcus limneticus Candia 3F8]